MAYKIKSKGRKPENYKFRSVEGITPKGFEFEEIKGKKIIYRRKEQIKHLKKREHES